MLKFFAILLSVITFSFSMPNIIQAADKLENLSITINIPSRILTLYAKDKVIKEYRVGIGKIDHETPIGDFKIRSKELNPTWIKPIKEGEEKVVIEAGPDNPLGYRWMEFADLYGIHGTNRPDSIGGYVSNGCVRMREKDVEELYDIVPLGTPVHITYERIIIKQRADKMVTLNIYPDEYAREPVSMFDINQKLAFYGVAGFVSNDVISNKLEELNSETLEVARTFFINISGKVIKAVGVNCDGINYLPVVPIATERKMAVSWDANTQTLHSPFGSAPGYVKNDVLYINSDYAYALYGTYIKWNLATNTMHIDNSAD